MTSILKKFLGTSAQYDVQMRSPGHADLRRVKSGHDVARNMDLIFISKDRVTSWGKDFNKLLNDPSGMQMFLEFLKKEVSEENIFFWCSCQKYQGVEDGKERINIANAIVKRHLDDDAIEPVNLNSISIKKIRDALANATSENPPDKELFVDTQKRIYNLMKTDTFPRFVKSDIYKRLVSKHNHEIEPPAPAPPPSPDPVEENIGNYLGEENIGNYLGLPQQFLNWLHDPTRKRLDTRMSSPI